jgi:hypothetical protein
MGQWEEMREKGTAKLYMGRSVWSSDLSSIYCTLSRSDIYTPFNVHYFIIRPYRNGDAGRFERVICH